MRTEKTSWTGTALLVFILSSAGIGAEPDPLDNYVDWGIYRGDKKGNQYADLAQINASNVHHLQPAWEYHTGDAGERTSMYSNPIMVDGRVYVSTPSLNAACIDAKTGEEIWFFDSSRYNEKQRVMQGSQPWRRLLERRAGSANLCIREAPRLRRRRAVRRADSELWRRRPHRPAEQFGHGP